MPDDPLWPGGSDDLAQTARTRRVHPGADGPSRSPIRALLAGEQREHARQRRRGWWRWHVADETVRFRGASPSLGRATTRTDDMASSPPEPQLGRPGPPEKLGSAQVSR